MPFDPFRGEQWTILINSSSTRLWSRAISYAAITHDHTRPGNNYCIVVGTCPSEKEMCLEWACDVNDWLTIDLIRYRLPMVKKIIVMQVVEIGVDNNQGYAYPLRV